MFKRLLIPIDFGALSDAALHLGRKLAAPGAQVRLVHVLTNETMRFYADLLGLERFARRAKEGLDAYRARYHAEDFQVEVQVRDGTIHRELLDEARQWQADVIVVGSHGRRGLQRVLLGSVAERLVRGAGVPVCVVKGEVREGERLASIALATDLEPTTAHATSEFARLLQGSGARGHLLHVFYSEHWLAMTTMPTPFVEGPSPGPGVSSAEIENRLTMRRGERRSELEAAAQKLRAGGLDVVPHLLDGEPWSEIARHVADEALDLLVLGTHKYSGLDHLILGSIAEKTLRLVGCPVLVVANRE